MTRVIHRTASEKPAGEEPARGHGRFVSLADRVAPAARVVRFPRVVDPGRLLFRVAVGGAEEIGRTVAVKAGTVPLRVRETGRFQSLVERRLFGVGKDPDMVSDPTVIPGRAAAGGLELIVGVVIHLRGQHDLLQIVRALHTASRFTRRLNGGQEQTDQDSDDRDNDQELDESKRRARVLFCHWLTSNKTPKMSIKTPPSRSKFEREKAERDPDLRRFQQRSEAANDISDAIIARKFLSANTVLKDQKGVPKTD